MKLTVDPPGRFSFAYFAFFLSSLLSAAAPSDSDDLGKISDLQGSARAISRSTLQPLSGQMPQCLVYHLNLNSDVVALFGGAHLALEQSDQVDAMASCDQTGPPPDLHVNRWYPLPSRVAPQLHVVIQSKRWMAKPNLKKVAKRNSCVSSVNTSEVEIAFNQAPAPFPFEKRSRATSRFVGASLINCSASCLAIDVYS